MFKLALVASAANANIKNDLSSLQDSLMVMYDGLKATYHTDAAYKMSAYKMAIKKKAIVDAPYYKLVEVNESNGFKY